MLIVISPAKTLDFESAPITKTHTLPVYLDAAEELVNILKRYSPRKLASLMGISDELAGLNVARYASWELPFSFDNAKQAVLAFKGDVYTGLEVETFKRPEFTYAQKHLRILSGLYGVLKPLDLIQPYRLEMGTKLKTPSGDNLYQFWGTRIAESLQKELVREKSPVLVNLASNEYFKSVTPGVLDAQVITPVFKDEKNGKFKIISFFAKKARGMMAAYIINNKLKDAEDIKGFSVNGYSFNADMSDGKDWVFTREENWGKP